MIHPDGPRGPGAGEAARDHPRIDVDPSGGEVLLRVVAVMRLCHNDALHPSRPGYRGLFPAVLGIEGGAVWWRPWAKGVTSGPSSDHVIPHLTRNFAAHCFVLPVGGGKTISARRFRGTQGRGPLMPWAPGRSPRTAKPHLY